MKKTTITVDGLQISVVEDGGVRRILVDGEVFVPRDGGGGPEAQQAEDDFVPKSFGSDRRGDDESNAASESAASTQDVISFRTNPDGTVEVDAHSDSRSSASASSRSPSENSQAETTLGTMGVSHAVSTLSTAVATGISMLESANAFSHRNSVRMASSVQTIAGIYDATAASRRSEEGS